jgi:hypothetical protein
LAELSRSELSILSIVTSRLADTLQTILYLAEEKEIANRKAERLRRQAEEMPCYYDAQEGQL